MTLDVPAYQMLPKESSDEQLAQGFHSYDCRCDDYFIVRHHIV
jgi:hypothetical protein